MFRNILLLVTLFITIVSCAPSGPPPAARQSAGNGKPRWVIAYPSSYSSSVADLKRSRMRGGYEVISLIDPTPSEISAAADRLDLGQRHRDALLLVGSQKQVRSLTGSHGRMVGLPFDGQYGLSPSDNHPLFPVGRIPAESPTDARRMISKILSFEKKAATRDHDALLLVGNPMGKRTPVADRFITSLSKGLMKRADSSWTFEGAADVGGHPLEVSEAEFPRRFRKELSDDYAIGTYFGHSNDWIFAASGQSITFTSKDWKSIPGGSNKGLFLSCGCYSLQTPQAGGYQAVQSAGGPVAYIGASGESYAAIGYLAAQGLMDSLEENPSGTVGEWWLKVQNAISSKPMNPVVFGIFDRVDGSNDSLLPFAGVPLRKQRREHLEMWMLLGDPATQLFASGRSGE